MDLAVLDMKRESTVFLITCNQKKIKYERCHLWAAHFQEDVDLHATCH